MTRAERNNAHFAGLAAAESFRCLEQAVRLVEVAPKTALLFAQHAGQSARDCQTHTAKAGIRNWS